MEISELYPKKATPSSQRLQQLTSIFSKLFSGNIFFESSFGFVVVLNLAPNISCKRTKPQTRAVGWMSSRSCWISHGVISDLGRPTEVNFVQRLLRRCSAPLWHAFLLPLPSNMHSSSHSPLTCIPRDPGGGFWQSASLQTAPSHPNHPLRS